MPRSIASVAQEIAAALSDRGLLAWRMDRNIFGVCRLPLEVKVTFNKSVFTPVERMEKRTVGQFFVVRAVVLPKAPPGEDVTVDLSLTAEEAELERRHGAICIVATCASQAIDLLKARGLPL